MIKISIKLGSGKELTKLGQSGEKSLQKWFSTCQQYIIWNYRHFLGHVKNWCNSKVFVNIANFSCLIF